MAWCTHTETESSRFHPRSWAPYCSPPLYSARDTDFAWSACRNPWSSLLMVVYFAKRRSASDKMSAAERVRAGCTAEYQQRLRVHPSVRQHPPCNCDRQSPCWRGSNDALLSWQAPTTGWCLRCRHISSFPSYFLIYFYYFLNFLFQRACLTMLANHELSSNAVRLFAKEAWFRTPPSKVECFGRLNGIFLMTAGGFAVILRLVARHLRPSSTMWRFEITPVTAHFVANACTFSFARQEHWSLSSSFHVPHPIRVFCYWPSSPEAKQRNLICREARCVRAASFR